MADLSTVAVPIAIAGTINGIAAIRSNQPAAAFRVLFANTTLLVTLVATGQILNWEFAAMIAVLYLLGTLFISSDGKAVVDWFTTLIEGL